MLAPLQLFKVYDVGAKFTKISGLMRRMCEIKIENIMLKKK